VNSGLCGVSVESLAIGIAGQAIHDGETDGAGRVTLQAQVIMSASYRVVMLVHHKVMTSAIQVPLIQLQPGVMSKPRLTFDLWPSRCQQFLRKKGDMILDAELPRFDGSSGRLCTACSVPSRWGRYRSSE